MARTNLPVSAFVANSATGLTDPAGTTIDQANGMNVVMTTETVPPTYDAMRGFFLRVHNTAAGTQHVIIRAGKNPPSFRADLGDLTVAVATTATVWVGPLDMSVYAQADDSVNVDFDAGTTGTVTAFVAPANV
jgi:hypothetical protein